MRTRLLLITTLVALATLGITGSVPAQAPARKVVEVTMTSYKFDPSQIRISEGETVVIRLKNTDPFGRRHNFSTAYLVNIPLTVRGDGQEGTSEGRKSVAVEAGRQAEVEFVAKGRGSFAFLCSLFDHAEKGQTGMLFVQLPGSL